MIVQNRIIRQTLRIANDILPKLPRPWDGPITVGVKFLAIYDSILKFWGKQSSELQNLVDLIGGDGTKQHENDFLVQLFFSCPIINKMFEIRRVNISDYTEVIIANGFGGVLFFIEWRFDDIIILSSRFWASNDFNFEKLLDALWNGFDNKIHISCGKAKSKIKIIYTKIPWIKTDFFGTLKTKFSSFIVKHNKYKDQKVPRTYLFLGPPGVGKSTFALNTAFEIGGRVLHLNVSSLTLSQVNELGFLIDSLKPDFLIIDDMDKFNLDSVLPNLLEIFSEIKIKKPELVIILTANALNFDPALIRPGRIDEICIFDSPSIKDRALMLKAFLNVELPEPTITCLAKAADELSAAYLKEIALQLSYEKPYQVLGQIYHMKEQIKPSKKEE